MFWHKIKFHIRVCASRPMCFAIEHALFDFCDCLPGVRARTFCRAYRIRTWSRQSAESQKPAQQAGNSQFPDIVSGCRASLTCVWQLSPTQITTCQSRRQIPPSLGPRISPVVGMAARDNQHTADSIGNQHKDDIQQCLLDMAAADSSEAPESSFGKRRAAQVWRRLRVLSYDSGYSDNAPPQQQAH